MNIVIGTRGSKLALIQAQEVQQLLTKALPNDTISLHVIKTYGDVHQQMALHEMGRQGVFVKAIETKLHNHEIDLAVHSLKDLPAQLAEEFMLLNPLKAEDARDVILYRQDKVKITEDSAFVIGTGSERRKHLAKQLYPNADIKGIRGNVDSRLQKMENGEYDALILAAAGLHRLGMQERIDAYLDPTLFIPSAGQGILGLEIRKSDVWLSELLAPFADEYTTLRMKAERSFLQAIDGDCHMPIGAYLEKGDKQYKLYGLLGNAQCIIRDMITGNKEDVEMMGTILSKRLKKRWEEMTWA